MEKLNITETVIDKLGFSPYWDEDSTYGGRTLTFKNGTQFRIAEVLETDDVHEGYASMSNSNPQYIAAHFYFGGFFAIPKIEGNIHCDLFFLHEMYACIEKYYPECLKEFTDKCMKLNMEIYIESYLESRK